MISYRLKCENGHQFESWFKSSNDFDKLNASGLIDCVDCGSTAISKSLMAPSVSTSKSASKPDPHEMIAKMRKELKGAKNVGWQFAKEARAIHNGDKKPSHIYGKAEPEDAISLLEDGIGVMPLPFDPDTKDN